MTEDPLMGAGVPGSQTAVLGTGLGQGDVAAAAVPLLPGAEVPALVAAAAAGGYGDSQGERRRQNVYNKHLHSLLREMDGI